MVRLSILVAVCLVPFPAWAASDPAPIRVELNKLEPVGADCRATVVAENAGNTPLRSLKLDLVIFQPDGVVAKRLAAELGPLTARKTVVKTFPVTGVPCEGIGRMLVNDVLACGGTDDPVEGCVERIAPTSRAAAPFLK